MSTSFLVDLALDLFLGVFELPVGLLDFNFLDLVGFEEGEKQMVYSVLAWFLYTIHITESF